MFRFSRSDLSSITIFQLSRCVYIVFSCGVNSVHPHTQKFLTKHRRPLKNCFTVVNNQSFRFFNWNKNCKEKKNKGNTVKRFLLQIFRGQLKEKKTEHLVFSMQKTFKWEVVAVSRNVDNQNFLTICKVLQTQQILGLNRWDCVFPQISEQILLRMCVEAAFNNTWFTQHLSKLNKSQNRQTDKSNLKKVQSCCNMRQ